MNLYYSQAALELHGWALQENNRLKATRIYQAAQSLELQYREHHKSEVNDPCTKPMFYVGKPPNTGSSVHRP